MRRAEFFRQGKQKGELIKGKKWLLLSQWKNLSGDKRGELNELFAAHVQSLRRNLRYLLLKAKRMRPRAGPSARLPRP